MKELKIKQVKGYTVPVYPKGVYRKPDSDMLRKLALAGSASAILLLLAGCEDVPGGGTVGPPPVAPELPTEAQAKEVILQTFADNGLVMTEDQEVDLVFAGAESLRVNLDGWNDTHKVGFEYLEGSNQLPDTFEYKLYDMSEKVDSLFETDDGPYIKFLAPSYALEVEDNIDYITTLVQEMVDSLRAQGHI